MKISKSQKYISSCFPGWKQEDNYDFVELGRIWVVWNPLVELKIISKSAQMVSCSVILPHSTIEMVISFIYAFNTKEGKRELLEEIKQLRSANTMGHSG